MLYLQKKFIMSKTVKLELVDSNDKVSLFTIVFDNDNLSEFGKFMAKFRDNGKLRHDYQVILIALQKILEMGVQERYFRPEGKFSDNICALPINTGKLRLYCLRLSDKILIIGNGGEKITRTYEENEELNGYVIDLQKFESILKDAIKQGIISIEETVIKGYEDKIFKI